MVRTKHGGSSKGASVDNDNHSLSWRQEEDTAPAKPLQHGISPLRFYGDTQHEYHHHAGRRRQRDHLKKVLDQACSNTIRERRREVTTKQKLRRAAYKEVTSLRTWPLQTMAMEDYNRLSGGTTITSKEGQGQVMPEKEHGDSTGMSSSSMDEPKRVKSQDETLSPRKSTMRHVFKQEFLRELDIAADANTNKETNNICIERKQDCNESTENDCNNTDSNAGDCTEPTPSSKHDFLPALWCMEPRMFAVEKSAAGKRKYLVGQLGRFLDLYWRKCDPKNRHYYELIREKTPCRLYFDLEFVKAANPEITPETSEVLLEEFFQELATELQSVYSIQVDRTCVVDLDSSTEKKFSRHWIVHLPNQALFADAVAAGRFVKAFVGRLAEEAATGVLREKCSTLQKHLFVNSKTAPSQPSLGSETQDADRATNDKPDTKCGSTPAQTVSVRPTQSSNGTPNGLPDANQPGGEETTTCTPCSPPEQVPTTCFVDLGVYTRNRLFRLLGSSKFGKPASAALRIASSNTFSFAEGFANDSFYVPDIEKKSATNNETPGKENVDLESDMTKFLSAVDWTVHAQALADTLVVPMNGSKKMFQILQGTDQGICDAPERRVVQSTALSVSETTSKKVSLSNAGGVEKSPFPSLDDFVASVLGTRGGVEGSIRMWSTDCDNNNAAGGSDSTSVAQSITYQMSRNRWCERVGRAHKSNNIMWTVDLQNFTCVQTCHDPECRTMRFRGTPIALPESVRDHVKDALFERQLALMDEKTLTQKQQTVSRQEELDDAEFELALLRLDISGKGDNEDEPAVPQIESSEQHMDDSRGPTELLSDSMLYDAVLTNPELFP